jgi:hypothetical protein
MEGKNMKQLEHPQISEMNRKGLIGALNQPECEGLDYFGNELLIGDDVVEFEGEIVLRDQLDDFLQALGFTFKTL